MNYDVDQYVKDVMDYLEVNEEIKRRLAEDLRAHILNTAGEYASNKEIDAAIERMGDPKELAVELMDMLYTDKQAVVRELINTKAQLRKSCVYEFKTKRTFFGLPLVHIHITGGSRYSWGRGRLGGYRPAIAKGIIAIGDISMGLISIGGLALGGLCFGGVALGALTFGGLGLGLLIGIGGMGVGSFAMGGLAIGQFAFGGCALASHVAIGGYARATVAIGGIADGMHTIATGGTSLTYNTVSAEEVRALILTAYPTLWKPLVDILTLPFR